MAVFRMPSLGADMEAGTLSEWLVAPGDEVRRGDIIAVVETQKGAIEIECFEEGRVQDLLAQPGAELPVGAPLALILAPGESAPEPEETGGVAEAEPEALPAASEPASPAAPEVVEQPQGDLKVSPAARMRAREHGIELSLIEGTGPGGAILLSDVERHARQRPVDHHAKPQTQIEEMRKAISAAMTRAKKTIPHFYMSQVIDIQPAIDWLETRNRDKPPGERLLLGAVLVRAAALAARKAPELNGHFLDGGFRPAAQVDAGIAIALRGGGLVAPSLNDAGALDLDATMAGMRDLVTRARAGRLRSSEMRGGTITISSLGESGAEAMAAVIFPPQVAIVGIGAPQLRPWVVDGEIMPRMVINMTVSADHRVSNGRQVAKYIAEFETLVKRPEDL